MKLGLKTSKLLVGAALLLASVGAFAACSAVNDAETDSHDIQELGPGQKTLDKAIRNLPH